MPLNERVLAIKRDRMKVQVEGFSGQQMGSLNQVVPGRQEPSRLAVIDAAGIFREVALFGKYVQACKQSQSLIGNQGHDVTLALDGPELESQAATQSMLGGNHFRAGQTRRRSEPVHLQPHQISHEKKQPTATGGESARAQRQLTNIGDGFHRGTRLPWPLFIQAAGQRGETLRLEDFPHASRAQRAMSLLKNLADLVNGVVLLAQLDDQFVGGRLFGLGLRAVAGRDEKNRSVFPAEVMAENMEGIEGIAESARDLFGGAALDDIG